MTEKIYIECTCGFVGVTTSEEAIDSDSTADDELELESETEACPRCLKEIIPIDDEEKMNQIDDIIKNRKKGIANYTNEDDND